MTAALRDALERSAKDRNAGAAYQFSYRRGHALSGVTSIEVDGAGHYSITSNETVGRRSVAFSGTLDEADRRTLLKSMLDGEVLETSSSTRPLADDEIPILLTIRADGSTREIRVWDGDAKALPGFHAFDALLLALAARLSDGAIVASAD